MSALLKVTVLRCPAENWSLPGLPQAYSRLLGLRLAGYGEEYKNVLSVDAYDMIADHLLVEEELPGGVRPLMCYRFMRLSKARQYRLDFPALGVVRSSGAAEHEKAIQEIIASCDARSRELAYVGSWTIHPTARSNRELTHVLREFTLGSHVHFHEEYGVDEAILCGHLRFKTHLIQMQLGYRPLELSGVVLSQFKQYSLWDEPVMMLHLKSFSAEGRALAEKYRYHWVSREEFGRPAVEIKKAA